VCLSFCWLGTAHAQVKLEHKFREGNKLTYKTTSKTHQELTLMGMEIPTGEDRTMVSSLSVGQRRADSSLPVERKVESLRLTISLPGGNNLNYDSSDPNVKIDNPDLAFLGGLFKLASEVVYTIVLDGQNKVKAIEGTERLQEKADKLDPMARDLIRAQFESDKLKRAFEQELHVLPDVLARPGEPWERTEILEIGGGQTLTFSQEIRVRGNGEERGQDAGQAQQQGARSHIQARSGCEYAAESDQEQSQGGLVRGSYLVRPRGGLRGKQQREDADQRGYYLFR
jgi:hypothetical protein